MILSINNILKVVLIIIIIGCKENNIVNPQDSGQLQGRVLDYTGKPVRGGGVIINNTISLSTSTDGTFSANEISLPCNIIVVAANVTVFNQITQRNVTLTLLDNFAGPIGRAVIHGQVQYDDSASLVGLWFENGIQSWAGSIINNAWPYEINVEWDGTNRSVSGTIHVLKTNKSGTKYTGYVSKVLTLNNLDDIVVDFQKNDFQHIESKTLSGGIVNAPNNQVSTSYFYLMRDNFQILNFRSFHYDISSFSIPVPVLPNTTIGIFMISNSNNGGILYAGVKNLIPGDTTIKVIFNKFSKLVSPSYAAVVDSSVMFRWNENDDTSGTNLLLIEPNPTQAGIRYYVWTKDDSSGLPDLSMYGRLFPKDVNYTWRVMKYHYIPSVDVLVSHEKLPFEMRFNGGLSRYSTFKTKN